MSDDAIIEANHAVYKRLKAQVELLTIQLRLARGQWVGLHDRWRAKLIMEQYPEFKE